MSSIVPEYFKFYTKFKHFCKQLKCQFNHSLIFHVLTLATTDYKKRLQQTVENVTSAELLKK